MDHGYEYKTDNHKQKPCSNFLKSYHMPYSGLRRIYPNFTICSDIFGDPYKEGNEKKSYAKIHRIIFFVRSKVYMSSSKCENHKSNDDISEIPDKMM